MRILQSIRNFFFGPAIDEFERRIYLYAVEKLPEEQSITLKSQFDLFNRAYRFYKNPDTSSEVYVCHFYWYKYFKNRLDFPRMFPIKDEEEELCRFQVILYSGEVINIAIWVVIGIACYIEIQSDSGIYRPLSPNFDFKWLGCKPIGEKKGTDLFFC
jgi:hypothetical protein